MATINKNFKVKNGLDVSGNTTIQGTITATTFIGDGSGLTNVGSSSGLSAYQIAVNNGFVGTEQQWLDSLVGSDGPTGATGPQGVQGIQGETGPTGSQGNDGADGMPGDDGASAYEVALFNGFVGTEQQWLASLVGPYGADGAAGADGMNGMDGLPGDSAYQIYLNSIFPNFVSEQDWLASLVGPTGSDGMNGMDGSDGMDGADGPPGPRGFDGSDGSDGQDGVDGASAYQIAVNNGFVGTEAQWLASLQGASATTPAAVSDQANTSTGYFDLPAGTTAQRPASPGNGMIRFNTSTNFSEYYNGTAWIPLVGLDGSTSATAAPSAQYIKDITSTATSGYYWISLGGTPTQVWCDMSSSTAWMLVMRASSGGTAFHYDSAYWTNGATGLNDTSNPLTNTDIKNGALWNSFPVNSLRLTGSTNVSSYTANPLTFSTFNTTSSGIFTAGSNTWDAQIGYSRAEWLNWAVVACGNSVSNFDSQPNCNVTAISNTGSGPYARIRLGWTGNNENDCATNDSWVGIGGHYNGSQLNGGAQSWSPSVYTPCHLWLWVR